MHALRNYPVDVLRRTTITVADGATITLQPRVPCLGFKKLVGAIHCTGGTPAAGFPRVRQFADQATTDGPTITTGALPQDTSQDNTTYVIDVDIKMPYCTVEYAEAAGGGTTIEEAYATLLP